MTPSSTPSASPAGTPFSFVQSTGLVSALIVPGDLQALEVIPQVTRRARVVGRGLADHGDRDEQGRNKDTGNMLERRLEPRRPETPATLSLDMMPSVRAHERIGGERRRPASTSCQSSSTDCLAGLSAITQQSAARYSSRVSLQPDALAALLTRAATAALASARAATAALASARAATAALASARAATAALASARAATAALASARAATAALASARAATAALASARAATAALASALLIVPLHIVPILIHRSLPLYRTEGVRPDSGKSWVRHAFTASLASASA